MKSMKNINKKTCKRKKKAIEIIGIVFFKNPMGMEF